MKLKKEGLGKLISLSGLDGSGKTTQAINLKKRLESEGASVNIIHLKKFDNTKYLLKSKDRYRKFIAINGAGCKEEEHQIGCALLYYEKVVDIVGESLKEYDYTILDRYIESAICRHYILEEVYASTVKIYNSLYKPDYNIFINVSPWKCFQRIKKRKEQSPYESLVFLKKAQEYYKKNKGSFIWLNGEQSSMQITEEILRHIM